MARATATRTRRIVRQRAKGPIDRGPGDRVRALRSARGLTQADLAGNEFSKGFISLLETGRTRVSLRAAEIIASKLGVGVAELLTPGSSNEELELILVRGESELRAGNAERVLPLLERWRTDHTCLTSVITGDGALVALVEEPTGQAVIAALESPSSR